MELVDNYSLSAIVRCIAINKVKLNSGQSPGVDNIILLNDIDKLNMFKLTNIFNYNNRLNVVDLKTVSIPKKNGKFRSIGISNIKDRVLQTQLCLLLDAFYEAKYSENMYGYRKGRNCLQAVGYLHKVISLTDKNRLGVALLDIKECFDNIPHEIILKNFKIPIR